MLVCLDIDGTIDADPVSFESLMSALTAAGHRVVILTGCSSKKPGPRDLADKRRYLNSIGVGHCYDEVVVFGDPPHKAKAKWLKKHNADILIDNSVKNAQLAASFCTVLMPWNNKAD